MTTPKITVLMSVYNDERYVSLAIESILNQTFTDFEFLIINDGSTDTTPHILNEYAKRDNRIKVVHQDNIGLTNSLNKGLKLAQGEYIARIDSDDISFSNRLQKQVDFLDNNPNIGVLGSGAEIIDEQNNTINRHSLSLNPYVTRWRLLFGNCLLHSTIMIRKNIVVDIGGYPSDCSYGQDYDLWSILAFKTIIYQLPDILIQYRVNRNAISFRYHDKHIETAVRIVHRNINHFFKMNIPIEMAKVLCDSVMTRNLPFQDGKMILKAFNLWLKFRKFFMLNYHIPYAMLKETDRDIRKDILRKMLLLLRSCAGYYPYYSLYGLMKTFLFMPGAIFSIPFWIVIIKSVFGQKNIVNKKFLILMGRYEKKN